MILGMDCIISAGFPFLAEDVTGTLDNRSLLKRL